MRHQLKYTLLLPVMLIALISCSTNNLECGDLLARYETKPHGLEFIECKKGTGQIILEAKYKVSGDDSHEIEEFLIEEYGIGRLKFGCCGWESQDGKNGYVKNSELLKIDPDYVLEVSMYGSAERQNEAGEPYIELIRTKVDFIVVVRVLVV